MTVRSSGALAWCEGAKAGKGGACEPVGASSCEPIRRDKERAEWEAFERLRAELQHAFAASEDTFLSLSAAKVIARNSQELNVSPQKLGSFSPNIRRQ
jgi:hypothetical protein